MRSLPTKARIYLISVYLIGMVSLCLPVYPLPKGRAQAWDLGLFLILATLAGGKKFRLMRHQRAEDVGSFSIGFTITFAAMLHFGPRGGIWVGSVSCLSSCLYPKRQPLYQLLFNLCLTILHTWAMSLVFLALNGGTLTLTPMDSFPGEAAACLTGFFLNTGGVATIIALCTGQRVTGVWKETFLWTAPNYFIGAFISTVGTLVLGHHTGAVLLFGSPIAYLTYKSYSLYIARTQEKEQHIEQLQSSHAQLADQYLAERQRAHAQKMQSVGQLAAGIAHEINTPTQYINSNIRFLQEAFASLCKLHAKYGELLAASRAGIVDPALAAEVEAAAEEADIEYLLEEAPKAIQQALEGIAHVAMIVQAMKEFSHPGTETKVAVDINRAIENTLTISRHEWKYVADIFTELDPHLPLVPCLPGQFNQVLLNILVNGVQAIRETLDEGAERKGVIAISTRLDGTWVEICVRDTGPGIPEAIRSKVFDPFFTTKEVGKGTGQGLAIAHSIVVDKHGGTIGFETETGKGTTFLIRLPLNADIGERAKAA